jgi:DNA helicase-2/ATP-dependent DNA helicase PcrA
MALLQPGQKVEHQKFGFGKVLNIQEEGPNRKATIHFDAIGEKTLMLSFAKLMIHE